MPEGHTAEMSGALALQVGDAVTHGIDLSPQAGAVFGADVLPPQLEGLMAVIERPLAGRYWVALGLVGVGGEVVVVGHTASSFSQPATAGS